MKKRFNLLTFGTLFALLLCLSCGTGEDSGIRVLGEVRETGEPIFILPGEQRLLLVVTYLPKAADNSIETAVYGGRSLRRLELEQQGGAAWARDSNFSVWYMPEMDLQDTDSSDLEFSFTKEEPSVLGQSFQTIAVLLEGVDPVSPFCALGGGAEGMKSASSLTRDCLRGGILLAALTRTGLAESRISGFARINPSQEPATTGFDLYARYLSGEGTAEGAPAGISESLLLGLRPKR